MSVWPHCGLLKIYTFASKSKVVNYILGVILLRFKLNTDTHTHVYLIFIKCEINADDEICLIYDLKTNWKCFMNGTVAINITELATAIYQRLFRHCCIGTVLFFNRFLLYSGRIIAREDASYFIFFLLFYYQIAVCVVSNLKKSLAVRVCVWKWIKERKIIRFDLKTCYLTLYCFMHGITV